MFENKQDTFFYQTIAVGNPIDTIYYIKNQEIPTVDLNIFLFDKEVQTEYLFENTWTQYISFDNYIPIDKTELFDNFSDTNYNNYEIECFCPVTINFDKNTLGFSGYFVLMYNRTIILCN
jgi:hypothetical protein